ncbi:3-oxoadipate enol-lactonase [Nocardiopsis sediminis]|uniref:3-oxoadipate enol-lactonase n=1 Tax=Nocardiopsis sediminis TaxID=1778267 RepID=A0ABV8FHD6_9ACTN
MSIDVHYAVDGPEGAPVVVLAGSLGSTLEMWGPQVAALAGDFRVVRYDTRGHGSSPVPEGPYDLADLGGDLLRLLDRVGAGRAHLAGLSLGGMTAMWVAAHAPERVGRLALLCTSAHLGPPEGWADRAKTVRAGGTGAVAEGVVSRWLTPGYAERRPSVAEWLRRMVAGTPAEGYAACCGAIERMDLRGDLARIGAPTLVVAGADDPATPPVHAEAIAAGIGGARLHVLEPAAHLASWEQAGAVNELLRAHFGAVRHTAGTAVRRAVLGDRHVDRAGAAATPFTEPFQDLISRYAWGEIWTRPGLDRRTRSCMVLTAMVALGHWDELGMHVRAARRNGLSAEEIGEVFLQAAIYCGVPAANKAFGIAQRILAETEEAEG